MLVLYCLCLFVVVAFAAPTTTTAAADKVGFAFSGAGGRAGQHAALMSALINGTYPGGKPIRPDYLSGASTGALSAVMLGAIIETKERNLGFMGVDMATYKSLLFSMSADQIYKANVISVTTSVFKGFILDRTPMEGLIKNWIRRLNYTTMGDLYIPTCISIVDRDTGFTRRLWSDDPQYAHLDLFEVLMATTALPIAFEPRRITGLPGIYIDGGTGVDTLPVAPLLERGVVKTVYACAYASALTSGGSDLPSPLNKILLLGNALAVVADMRVDLYLSALEVAANDHNVTTYSYIPKLSTVYSVLDFSHEREEFNDVAAWTALNAPRRVDWSMNPQPTKKSKVQSLL